MKIARWISRGSFLFLLLYVGAPWRPLVRFLTPMTVHGQTRMPVNAALAPDDKDLSPEGIEGVLDKDFPEMFERCRKMIAERQENPTDTAPVGTST